MKLNPEQPVSAGSYNTEKIVFNGRIYGLPRKDNTV